MKPTLYLSNWACHQTKGFHGTSGRKYTIMAMPRSWEYGDGSCSILVPSKDALLALQAQRLTMGEYEAIFRALRDPVLMSPGVLYATVPGTGDELVENVLVQDGDTLCCACSLHEAKRSRCHRVWSAEMLVEAGWSIVLDGERL